MTKLCQQFFPTELREDQKELQNSGHSMLLRISTNGATIKKDENEEDEEEKGRKRRKTLDLIDIAAHKSHCLHIIAIHGERRGIKPQTLAQVRICQ